MEEVLVVSINIEAEDAVEVQGDYSEQDRNFLQEYCHEASSNNGRGEVYYNSF